MTLMTLDSESQFPHLFKQFNIPAKFAPQNPRTLAQKAEEEAWKSSSSLVYSHVNRIMAHVIGGISTEMYE